MKRSAFIKCNSCDKIFSLKGNLEKHLNVLHEEVNGYKCHMCNKYFGQMSNFETHFKISHEKNQRSKIVTLFTNALAKIKT